MIISEARNNIELRWRDSKGKRVTKSYNNFKPYFYIEAGDEMPEYISSSSKYNSNKIIFSQNPIDIVDDYIINQVSNHDISNKTNH